MAETRSRLSDELQDLRDRGKVNMAVGSIVAVVGVVILFGFTIGDESSQSEDLADVMLYFLPRLSLVLIVEVFAYFFLRLYSLSLTEIKYFQNEITNWESKLLSLRAAARVGRQRVVERVITEIAKTERNHVLRKGETTVAHERWRGERQEEASIGRAFLRRWRK
ncbi:MAG: hypothetical protein OXC14_04525 [Rhodospirillaceae bacterium]|nr:hypothetical protein [Rhodospirillaceae bacterium]